MAWQDLKERVFPPKPKCFKVAVKTKATDTWSHNGLRFSLKEDAIAYAKMLERRWPDIVGYDIQQCEEEPNCTYPIPNDRYPVKRG